MEQPKPPRLKANEGPGLTLADRAFLGLSLAEINRRGVFRFRISDIKKFIEICERIDKDCEKLKDERDRLREERDRLLALSAPPVSGDLVLGGE